MTWALSASLAHFAFFCTFTCTSANGYFYPTPGGTTSVADLFSNIQNSTGVQYDLKDDQDQQMACLHVYQTQKSPSSRPDYKYYGVYHSHVSTEFEVRLAKSSDLRTWTYVRTLIRNADMPYIYQISPNGWLLLAHKEWMNPDSQLPSQLGFKLYYNESQLFSGIHFNSFVAGLSVGKTSQLEGTPNIYSATLNLRGGYYMVDANIGFHYNDVAGVDQVATGVLLSFGPTVVSPEFYAYPALEYNYRYKEAGAQGNIGQRMAGTVNGERIIIQEANIGPMPPTIWSDWRVWLYYPQKDECITPSGAGSVQQLAPKTSKGSYAFGNPAFAVVDCPAERRSNANRTCLFVSYFIFSEGAGPGEAGVCTFYNEL